MISYFQRTRTKPDTPRRTLAAALAMLFAFCVLVASAPHRHLLAGGGILASEIACVAHRSSIAQTAVSASNLPADTASISRGHSTGEADCPLCDWLNAPSLPLVSPATTVLTPVSSSDVAVNVSRVASVPASPCFRTASRGPPTSLSF